MYPVTYLGALSKFLSRYAHQFITQSVIRDRIEVKVNNTNTNGTKEQNVSYLFQNIFSISTINLHTLNNSIN